MGKRSRAFALSAGALALAVVIRWALDPFLGDSVPLVTLAAAVAATVWAGGYRFAIPTAVAGYWICSYLFIQPRYILTFGRLGDVVGLIAYLVTCGVIIAIGEASRAARRRTAEGRDTLRATLASIGEAVITTNVAGRITYLNAAAEALLGWSAAEAVGQPLPVVLRIVSENTREPVGDPAIRAVSEGTVIGLPGRAVLIPKGGGERPIEESAAPIRDERGNISGCVLIFRDVTPQRREMNETANQLILASRLAAIVGSSDDAIISKSLDGVIQSWNAGAERVFGYSSVEAIGRHISLVIPPDRIGEEDQIIATLKAGRRVERFDTERVRKDGQRILVSLTISPIRDADGNIVGASKIARDVTQQRRAEADRQKFVTLVESSTDFIGMCDLQGIPSFVNRAGLQMVGLDDLEQARRVSLTDFFFPEDRDWILRIFLPSVLERGHGEVEIRFRHFKTGEARWMTYKVLTLPGPDGRPSGFATVSQDVTERKRLADDLRAVAADLSEINRRQTEFLAMLAHELRNPLAPISNAVRALRMGRDDPKVARQVLGMLERQVKQLSRLVEDLLDLSRVTRGKIILRKQSVELQPIVEQAVEAARALYANMNHELTVTLPTGPVFLTADPARVAQVVGNLLNNACKFTDPGGHVSLTVTQEDAQAVIRVRDDGIGIAAEQLPHLFKMFVQADTSLDRTRDGLGIGLTLVRALVEMHGGTVHARSEGPGRGSEFEVRFPALAQADAAIEALAPPEPTTSVGRRVLIVDDNVDGAESLALLLAEVGHDTYQAHDGLAAIADAERLRPDAVLLDIGLPKLNGYEVCRRIRAQPWGKRLMMVALTGWGQDEDRQRSQEAGFDTHLVKPVDYEALMQLLAALPADTARAAPPVPPARAPASSRPV